MANVTYDDRSFLVDGKRIWLVSGSIHYFRTPSALWRDRLLKAKRAGLNCIDTYVAWNFHESMEGQWDFAGDRDVAGFVRLAGELGLYVILRPGPYICSEWDFGGLPGWLSAKSGMAYRTSNAAYTHYYDKYFRQLLPRLADLQVTRGGNIILIQNENEYPMTTMPDRLSYLEFISQLFRRSGFDIPIITCNWLLEPRVPDTIECVNTWGLEVQSLKRLRAVQRKAPLLVTEFYPGWMDLWGGEHQVRSAAEVARRAMLILGCGAQLNYYMWHGGTNFAFWGGHMPFNDAAYQTTSYDYDAPLAEGGGLTPKYYLTRLVNVLASSMGEYFATCAMDESATSQDGLTVLNISGPLGRWAIVVGSAPGDPKIAKILLPDGQELTIPLETFGAVAVPVGLKLTESHVLDYSNLTPLGFFGKKLLVLHGPASCNAVFSVDSTLHRIAVPQGEHIEVIEHKDIRIAVVNSELAQRTWPVEGALVLGPRFVGPTPEDIVGAEDNQYAVLSEDGVLTRKKLKPAAHHAGATPKLSPLHRLAVCEEPAGKELEWKPLARPRDVDQLGVHYGYVWYRLEIHEDRAIRRNLYLPDCDDRAHLYLNGAYTGTWGRGNGAARSPIAAAFRRGPNSVVLLVDNMGRLNFGSRLGELKGLFGPLYDATGLKTAPFKLKSAEENIAKRCVPRPLLHLAGKLEALPMWEARLEIALRRIVPLHFAFRDLPNYAALYCNERLVSFFDSYGQNYGDVSLSAELTKGRNNFRLLLWGQVDPKSLQNVKFHVLEKNLSQGATCSYRPWQRPLQGRTTGPAKAPVWYGATFKYVPSDQPLFVKVTTPSKGQLFVNGNNVGRFWTIAPQQYYYLPEPWLRPQNELVVFSELGQTPQCKLEFRPFGPFAP